VDEREGLHLAMIMTARQAIRIEVAARFGFLVLLAGIASLVFVAGAGAAFPGANGRIAYVGSLPGEPHGDLFTVLPDGSGTERLTNDPAIQGAPSWSADGQRLVFAILDPDPERYGHSLIATMNADGSDVRVLARSGLNHVSASPSFKPSGRRIVFAKGRAIVSVRTDGEGLRRVVRARRRGILIDPAVSPDGRWIAFVGTPRGERGPGIWKARTNGRGLQRLTAEEPDQTPDFSPDGRRIVFSRYEQVLLMRADGKRERSIPNAFPFNFPAFAPAGDRITMSSFSSPLSVPCPDIYTISPNGSDLEQVTHYSDPGSCPPENEAKWGGATQPSWQPLPGP